MPRSKIDLPYVVEHLSILNGRGEVDRGLDPDIPKDLLLKLHRAMVVGPRFDERLLSLQRQGRIGTFAPITGQEASQLGGVTALVSSDYFVTCFRETAARLYRGAPMEAVILNFGGYGEGGSAHRRRERSACRRAGLIP